MKHHELLDKYDINQTGEITREDVELKIQILERELADQRNHAQRRMAWTAMISMVVVTMVTFLPIPGINTSILSDILPLFYVAQAGVVGAYMGFTTWMNR